MKKQSQQRIFNFSVTQKDNNIEGGINANEVIQSVAGQVQQPQVTASPATISPNK